MLGWKGRGEGSEEWQREKGATLFVCHLLAGPIKRRCLARNARPGTADNPSKCAKTNKVRVGGAG